MRNIDSLLGWLAIVHLSHSGDKYPQYCGVHDRMDSASNECRSVPTHRITSSGLYFRGNPDESHIQITLNHCVGRLERMATDANIHLRRTPFIAQW